MSNTPSSAASKHSGTPTPNAMSNTPSAAGSKQSAAEAELGALFLNAKEGKIICIALHELGHKQPPTPIHCDSVTATGIATDLIKNQRSRSMEMRFLLDNR